MTERMTSIRLPGILGSAVADRGTKTVPDMIALIRKKAELDKAIAEAILAASDGQFRVETYLGVHVRRDLKVLQ